MKDRWIKLKWYDSIVIAIFIGLVVIAIVPISILYLFVVLPVNWLHSKISHHTTIE